ncbi:YihY/virulence factor BrkB family protein [Blastococcus sp. PRF04-17]|uniref:YihY/virulence factor BrkB family protein n=1 Tax=Blastococcus sp. PRF04-17 TaxID=2933797 RepID=UPI001FF6B1E0|nr:YhjD/YihY/BrkB family envelope integrity protein [Blastococcus sp. PRF04-17]UOY01696.1 YihY/virulence factor BrkB family protein [Blastococcus sp. PRF04-17]
MRRFVDWLRSPEFVTTSASLAFYAMISLPPMVLIGFWIAGWFVDESALQELGGEVDEQAPAELPLADVLEGLIEVAGRTGALAAVAAVWPATTYGAALARAFSTIAPEADRRIRGWRGRLLSLVVIATFPLLVFSGLAATYVVPRLVGQGIGLTAVLGAGALALLSGVIGLLYSLFRLRDTGWREVATGAGVATALIGLSTAGYLGYLQFSDFTERYGTTWVATAVLLGLWLLLGNASLVVGYRVMLRRAAHRPSHDRLERGGA